MSKPDYQSTYERLKQQAQEQGRVQSASDFYANQGPEYFNTTIDMPKGPTDIIREPDEPWGKPPDWDYQTAQTGWKGEQLPPGAEGWKPDGTPHFGGENAFQDWWNGFQYNLSKPAQRDSDLSFAMSKETFKNKDLPWWQRALGGVTNFFEGVGNIGLEEGESPDSFLSKASRTTGQLLQGFGLGLGRIAEVTEKQVVARAQALEDIGDAGGVFRGGEDLVDREAQFEKMEERLTNWTNPILANNATEAMRFLSELTDVIVPMNLVWNGLRAVVSPISLQEKRDIMAERVQAGQILYTTFIEPAKKEQYLARVRDGEDPYLVSVELQNPWAEMGGQMILDPLNILGVVAKGSGVAKTISGYGDYMAKPLGSFGEFFAEGANKLLKFDDGSDITLMAERFINTRKSVTGMLGSMSVELNVEGAGLLGKLRPVVNKALERSGVFGWSASGKRHHLQRLTSDMMGIIVKTAGKDPDEALSVVKFMTKLQGDDVMEVAEALGNLGGTKVPLNYLTSEAGMRFGAVFKEMLSDADGVMDGAKFINKFDSLKGDLPALQKWLDGKIDNVAQQLFPDISKRAKVLGKIEAGDELTKAEMLIDATPLTGGEKFWMKAEGIANNKMLTSINAFFANVYMGLSPGYAFRNLITNELHVLTDLGPMKYAESWSKFNPAVAMDELVYMTRDTVGQMAEIGIGSSGQKGLFGQKMAGVFEKWGGQRLYGMGYKDTLDKMIPVVLDEVSHNLKLAGATDEQIAMYRSVANMTYGRFDEASEVLRQGMKTGQIDTFKLGQWLPEDMMKFYDHYGMGDAVRAIVRDGGDSVDAPMQKLKNLFADARRMMKKAETSISNPTRMDGDMLDGLEHYEEYFNTLENFNMANDMKQASKHAQMANRASDTAYQTALQDLRRIAGNQQIELDINDLTKGDPFLNETYTRVLDGTFYEPHATTWREQFSNPLNHWTNKIREDSANIEKAWKAVPWLAETGDMPKNMSADQFFDLVHNVIFPSNTRKFYGPLRDIHAETTQVLRKAYEKAGVTLTEAQPAMWDQAGEALQHAKAFDTHVLRDISWDELGRATGDMVHNVSLVGERMDDFMDIKKLGIVNGIPTSVLDPSGTRNIQTNNLLKTINKELRALGQTTYDHLDEVPFHKAELALKNKRGDKFNRIVRQTKGTQFEIPPALIDVLDEARITKPTTVTAEMDQRVKEMVSFQADLFKQELTSAPGKPGSVWVDEDKFAIGSEAYENQLKGRWGWNTPDWYGKDEVGGSSAYYKGEKGRKAVVKALEALVEGKDDNSAIFNRLRESILKRIDRGTPEDFMLDVRQKIQAYTPMPSEVDNMVGRVDDARDIGLIELRDEFGRLTGEWGFNPDDDFFAPTVAISSPASLSEPHSYLASAPIFKEMENKIFGLVQENFGKMQEVFDNPNLISALDDIDVFTSQQETVIRTTANEYATGLRNFGLVNYESRRNIDTLSGMVMPYQFWHGRTYTNWAQRIAKDPAIMANFYRYKQAMAESHAGLPEFWQDNVNSYELLGLFKDHPLFFNLEATLNPMDGLTGTDFNDPRKRVDGWSAMVDDLNRFGPSTHPIYNYALAFAYMLKGEGEASARWGGRLIPQTATFNALSSLLGFEAGTKEIDPAVWLFSGGIDPYMRRRVGRAFPQMIDEGLVTEEQAIDATWAQSGSDWESARQRAVAERAPGQLASFFLGVGFKGRNQGDIKTDMMYDEFYTLMNRRTHLSSDQFKESMNYLQQKYPFMDSVLISAKTGEARDMAFAYSILSRVQPGDSTRLFEMVSVDDRLVDKFYSSKGDFEGWAQSDKNRFMAGIIDLNAVLAIPDDYTAQQWTNAKVRYSQLTQTMEANFGEGIGDEINHFYALKNTGRDADADAFLQANPMVERAMEWKLATIVNDPSGDLEPYYVGINKIESYWMGQMYGQAKKKFGEGIFDLQSEYFTLETSGQKKQFMRENPKLKEYWEFRDEAGKEANKQIIAMASKLPEGIPQPIREDAQFEGIGAQDLSAGLAQPEDPYLQASPEQWLQALGDKDFGAVYQYLEGGESFSYQTKQRLRGVADELGMDVDRLVQYVGISLSQFEE